MIDKRQKPTRLLWVDLEITGLDPATDVILEIAAIVTDFDLTEIAAFEAIIFQSESVLARCDEWVMAQHTESGLLSRVRTQGKPEQMVRQELAAFIHGQFGAEAAILAGNSIHQDRIFIRSWWPDVEELLHYRMLDVSSLKVFMQGKYGFEFEKKNTHRALEDITASIAEWKYYVAYIHSAMRDPLPRPASARVV